ncbi:MAG: oxidoreductase [Nitrospinae bacterium CG11_big_fil_rev_8_21_14_0_20_56_8]|nr:MAG: oxidoreductase [Nitrospinae bacterium CG11_big_fil_rev_8_21_14_0_20_56_8]
MMDLLRNPFPRSFRLWEATLLLLLAMTVGVLPIGAETGESTSIVEGLELRHAPDIQIQLFARVPGARHMAFDDQGILFVSQTRQGQVSALPDAGEDGRADRLAPILEGADHPHGLAFAQLESGYYLYIAEERRVIRMKRVARPLTYDPPEILIDDIPGGGHFTRTIKIKDGKLYLSVGSSCNVCIEKDPMRAAISRFNLDGTGKEIFARGLRNSVGIEFSPYTGELWGVNNGRDWQGDDHPREELNIIREGRHYGWPFCNEDRVPDPDFGDRHDCSRTVPPAYSFTAHMAPLGLAFYTNGKLPARYDHSLFIAFHGSWNRSAPAGYKVVRVALNAKGEILSDEDFITGWLKADGKPWGRPVDLERSPAGDLYLSDDFSGAVYRIRGKQK